MNIIIGSNGFLGSYLNCKLNNTLKIISNSDTREGIKYNNFIKEINNYNDSVIYICADHINNKKIINDLLKLTNENFTFILFSSAVYYETCNNNLIYKETDLYSNLTDDNYVKYIRENEVEFKKLKGVKIIIRLGTLYGSSLYLNASRGVQRMIYFPLINNYLELSDIKIRKSLTSLDDLFDAINIILDKQLSLFEIYNVSSFNTTIEELGNFIANKFKIEIKYVDSDKKNYNFHLDTTKLRSLGWKSNSNLNNLIQTITSNFNLIKEVKYDNKIIYYTKNICRVCESNNLFTVLDLKNQSPPNRLNDNFWELLNFPLILNCCSECYHLQLNGVLNPIILYKNYSYLSGTSNTMKNYFDSFVNSINKNNKKKILDIACNDCVLLDVFKKNNFDTYGIDPAENIVSNINNHNIYCGIFNNDAINYYDNIIFDIVTAFNVFGHVDNIYEFLNNLSKITDINSDIYIQTSQCNMIQNNEFDTIYHEHLSFFNVFSMSIALEKNNFSLINIKIVEVHGSSYLFHIKKKVQYLDKDLQLIFKNVVKRHNYEIETKIFNKITYENYSNNIYLWKNKLIELLKNRKKIIGIGASAKGITILNFIKDELIKNNIIIECILDENPFKINKYINSINVQILDLKDIYLVKKDVTFILFAWNFKDELINKIKLLRNNKDEFINLFPLEILN